MLNYNVSCILTLPPYQRKGYGRLLIDFSEYTFIFLHHVSPSIVPYSTISAATRLRLLRHVIFLLQVITQITPKGTEDETIQFVVVLAFLLGCPLSTILPSHRVVVVVYRVTVEFVAFYTDSCHVNVLLFRQYCSGGVCALTYTLQMPQVYLGHCRRRQGSAVL